MREHNILSTHEIAVLGQPSGRHRTGRMRRIILPLVAVGMIVCALAWGIAGPNVARADSAAPQLEGAWRARVGISGGPAPFTTLFTFNRGGTLQVIDETQLETPSATTGLGAWTRIGGDQYGFTWQSYLFGPASAGFPPAGRLQIRGVITLTGNDTYTSASQFTVYNTEGNVIASGCTTGEATRMIVEPLADCPGADGSVQINDTNSGLLKSWRN